MSKSRSSEHTPLSMSDEQLIQELAFWGEGKHADSRYRALKIQRQVLDRSRKSLRMTLVACSVFAATIMSTAWLTHLQRQDARQKDVRPSKIATDKAPIDLDPELLLKFIAQRTQEIDARIEELNSRREQQRFAASEIQDLNARLLHYKKVAFRNAIVLNQIP